MLKEGEVFEIEELGLWCLLEEGSLTVGFTLDTVSDEEVANLQLPDEDEDVVINDPVGSLAISGEKKLITAPATGIITEINETLLSDLSLLQEDPEGEGWLFKIAIQDESELFSYF